MEFLFVPPDLRRIDGLSCEACWLPFFEDERPFRGVLGLIDWRMGAYLSRQVIRGRVCGKAGDLLLLPCEQHLPFEKLFLLGLGKRDDFDQAGFMAAVNAMLETLSGLRVRAAVCSLPGRTGDVIDPETAMAGLLQATRSFAAHDELTLVETSAAQRQMEPLIAQERRRARASE